MSLRKLIEQYLSEKDYSTISKLLDIYYEEIQSVGENELFSAEVSSVLNVFF